MESLPGTQKTSSSSRPSGSSEPATAQLKFSSSAWQCSKCPISSEYETFVVCADHVFPRTSAVLYSGWNAYGADWHGLSSPGVKSTWANPFAIEAVIDPLWCVSRSVRSARNPAAVSCRWIRIRSPGFISKSLL